MLVVKKFGHGTCRKERSYANVEESVLKITKKEMMLLLSYQQWVR